VAEPGRGLVAFRRRLTYEKGSGLVLTIHCELEELVELEIVIASLIGGSASTSSCLVSSAIRATPRRSPDRRAAGAAF